MPEIIIVAGPNGAGKTSFARQYLVSARTNATFVNADEIARKLRDDIKPQVRRDIEAARRMLQQMDALASARQSFAIETTLSALTYVGKIAAWRESGYRVTLIYLRLPSADHAVERVRRRVVAGGHGIPEDTVRRRFELGLLYLEKYYKSAVDEWYILDSHEGNYVLAEKSPSND